MEQVLREQVRTEAPEFQSSKIHRREYRACIKTSPTPDIRVSDELPTSRSRSTMIAGNVKRACSTCRIMCLVFYERTTPQVCVDGLPSMAIAHRPLESKTLGTLRDCKASRGLEYSSHRGPSQRSGKKWGLNEIRQSLPYLIEMQTHPSTPT